ncbi:MAG TPA: organomercurial lyase [Thermoanaerobaculia bacterium]
MDFDTEVKTAIYRWVAETTRVPTAAELAQALRTEPDEIRDAYRRLFTKRVLFLEPDGETIRMAPPFSGVETQHRVLVGGRLYFANCSWDALGIPAALHAEAEVFSRCEQTLEPIHLRVSRDGPAPEPAGPETPGPKTVVAHFAVPAAKWWADLVYT